MKVQRERRSAGQCLFDARSGQNLATTKSAERFRRWQRSRGRLADGHWIILFVDGWLYLLPTELRCQTGHGHWRAAHGFGVCDPFHFCRFDRPKVFHDLGFLPPFHRSAKDCERQELSKQTERHNQDRSENDHDTLTGPTANEDNDPHDDRGDGDWPDEGPGRTSDKRDDGNDKGDAQQNPADPCQRLVVTARRLNDGRIGANGSRGWCRRRLDGRGSWSCRRRWSW